MAGGPDVADSTVAAVRRDAETALRRVREVFPEEPHVPFRIVVHGRAADLPAELQSAHHEGSPGFALLARHEIHVLLDETRAAGTTMGAVLVHELTHELLDQACQRAGGRIPRWFHEGLAQFVAGDTYLGASEEAIIWRAASRQLLPFSGLTELFPRDPALLKVAYAQSYSYVAWLVRELGMKGVLAVARAVDDETSFDRALVMQARVATAALEDGWCDHVVNGSGARWRLLLQSCFSLSIIFSLPLLALAMIRRLRADRAARERMELAPPLHELPPELDVPDADEDDQDGQEGQEGQEGQNEAADGASPAAPTAPAAPAAPPQREE